MEPLLEEVRDHRGSLACRHGHAEAVAQFVRDGEGHLHGVCVAWAVDGLKFYIGERRLPVPKRQRSGTLRAVDRVVALVDGRVAETGTAEELLAAGGYFAKLTRENT